ncbi:MAG: hypothetical protein EBZ50_03815 [Alphaproteobacteria bacterium]|nr:hypothetical protein [Alphaproteobacteria bacterium]
MADTLEYQANAELRAAEMLKASLADALALDPDLLLDTLEGETGILEIVDELLLAELADAAHVEALKDAKATLDARKQRFEARQATRRALIEQAMMLLERKKLERPTATLSLSERAPSVKVEDESAIPSKFFTTKPVLDLAAVKDAVKAGEDVPGAVLTNGSVSLTIRRR